MSTTDTGSDASGMIFNASNVNLDMVAANPGLMTQVICYLELGQNEYDGGLGVRISALFVIMIVSTMATFFPVVAARVRWVRVPLYVYLFARYFGAGVIIATAFIHLLDPAYGEIGPNTCVGYTAGWNQYSWPPALALVSIMVIFLMDFAAERYVETKYHLVHADVNVESIITDDPANQAHDHGSHQFLHTGDQHSDYEQRVERSNTRASHSYGHHGDLELEGKSSKGEGKTAVEVKEERLVEQSFQTQIAAFLILEFGVIFHSVIIGLNLGTAGSEFKTLYPVLVFHQSFEGLGIGARMSAIPFPERLKSLPWVLCTLYGLTTPVAIAIGLGLRTTYNPNSFTANVVSGVLDSISAGILIFTGLVELLARDFLFDPNRTKDNKRLAFMIGSVLLGAAIMALLGKWA